MKGINNFKIYQSKSNISARQYTRNLIPQSLMKMNTIGIAPKLTPPRGGHLA
jgi:hypothetical protein